MNTPKKSKPRDLPEIDEALIESILNASDAELREEIIADGDDPARLVVEFDAMIARAKTSAASEKVETAKAELAAWRSNAGTSSGELEAARERLERLQAGDADQGSEMMMAARKGTKLSDRDLEGLAEDLADLDRLETKDQK